MFIIVKPTSSYSAVRVSYIADDWNVSNQNGPTKPTVYLKKDVKIKSGTGTSGDPYILGNRSEKRAHF